MVLPDMLKIIFAVWRTTVRGSVNEYGVFFQAVYWGINGGKKPYTISHGDVLLMFGIVFLKPATVNGLAIA